MKQGLTGASRQDDSSQVTVLVASENQIVRTTNRNEYALATHSLQSCCALFIFASNQETKKVAASLIHFAPYADIDVINQEIKFVTEESKQ